MNDSILGTIKRMLGYDAETDTPFDTEIIQHINSAFSVLTQLGLGPSSGFSISDAEAVWSDIIPEGMNLEMVKQYVYLKVRVIWDPPASSAALEAMKAEISQDEFRISVEVDK